jgi:hypothetical protein
LDEAFFSSPEKPTAWRLSKTINPQAGMAAFWGLFSNSFGPSSKSPLSGHKLELDARFMTDSGYVPHDGRQFQSRRRQMMAALTAFP